MRKGFDEFCIVPPGANGTAALREPSDTPHDQFGSLVALTSGVYSHIDHLLVQNA
jgi:hypothetical protein